jgi:hypothetical protein
MKRRAASDVSDLPLSELLAEFWPASKAVWNDGAVWIEERDRREWQPLAWPRASAPTKYEGFLAELFNSEVEVVLHALHLTGHPALPRAPYSVVDPAFQIVLRVVHRAVEAGIAAIETNLADRHGARVTGLKGLRNDYTASAVRFILKYRIDRQQGYAAFAISKPGAHRAMKRVKRKP